MQSPTIHLNFPPISHLLHPKFQYFASKINLCSPRMTSSLGGFRVCSKMGNDLVSSESGFLTLTEYAGKGGANVGDDLVVLYSHLEYAFKKIAALVASPFNASLGKSSGTSIVGSGRDKPKPLDIVSILFCPLQVIKELQNHYTDPRQLVSILKKKWHVHALVPALANTPALTDVVAPNEMD